LARLKMEGLPDARYFATRRLLDAQRYI